MSNNYETTLFIGNGLNRTLTGGVEWSQLLKKISEKYHTDFYKNQDMPLEFERIINEYLQNSKNVFYEKDRKDIYKNIKSEIANIVMNADLDDDCIHKSIPFDSVNNIITTNYDHLLEKAYVKTSIIPLDNKNISNIKYLNERFAYSEDEKISYFHAHGSMKYPNTICLGYEHYMGIVEHLRKSINSGKKKMRIIKILKGEDNPQNTWGEKFYTSNMAIVGFGLPSCETDIWWLLNHRAYLYNTNYDNIRSFLNNKIVYYEIVNDDFFDNDKDYNSIKYKHKLLENLHVDVKVKKLVKNDYKLKYQEILDEVKYGNWL